jgi:endonuclease/exonuclease/phosphatase family metal-dependent hydrolase
VRIVSVNAWGGALLDELIGWLPGCGADVLCLQEVCRTPGATGWIRFDDGERSLPQRADLHGDVVRALPDHQAFFVTCDSGPVRDPEGIPRRQDFGIATYVAPAVPVIGLESAFVHGRYREHDRWPTSNRPRAALAVRVTEPRSGRPVTVVQLHGLRDESGKQDTPARDEQARRLAALVEHARAEGDITVVCGDFNLLPGSRTFDVLSAIGLTDLVGQADTRTSRYDKPVRHAGYLLISDPAAVRSFRIVDAPEVSDHRPLVLDL